MKKVLLVFVFLVLATTVSATANDEVPYDIARSLVQSSQQGGKVIWAHRVQNQDSLFFGACYNGNLRVLEVYGTAQKPNLFLVGNEHFTDSNCGTRHDFWVKYDLALRDVKKGAKVKEAMRVLNELLK